MEYHKKFSSAVRSFKTAISIVYNRKGFLSQRLHFMAAGIDFNSDKAVGRRWKQGKMMIELEIQGYRV